MYPVRFCVQALPSGTLAFHKVVRFAAASPIMADDPTARLSAIAAERAGNAHSPVLRHAAGPPNAQRRAVGRGDRRPEHVDADVHSDGGAGTDVSGPARAGRGSSALEESQ